MCAADISFTQLLHREGKVSVGEGFVLQREVPPLGVEGLKAMTEHSLTENHAVLELLGGDATFRIRVFGRLELVPHTG